MALSNLAAALTNNVNPAVALTGTTTSAINSGETAWVFFFVPQETPTAVTCTIGGNSLTQDINVLRAGDGNVYLFRINAGSTIATSAAIACGWTQGGTVNAGGAVGQAFKTTQSLVAGAPDVTGTGTGLSTSPAASCTPSSATSDYVVVGGWGGGNVGAAGKSTPSGSYTAFTESYNGTRDIDSQAAGQELTHAVASQTITWGPGTLPSIQWAAVIAAYKINAGGGGGVSPPIRARLQAVSTAAGW